jgi:hypothetical protein
MMSETSLFIRLLKDKDKATALAGTCSCFRGGEADSRIFVVAPESFEAVPGKPFAYWVSDAVRHTFQLFPPFEGEGRTVKIGMKTGDDFRFLRLWWEEMSEYRLYAKGGATDAFYGDITT